MTAQFQPQIVIVGLGYVGLSLAIRMAAVFPTIGLDIDPERVAELRSGHDRTGEVEAHLLEDGALRVVDTPGDCPPADVYIVTVPTPVDANSRPDLTLIKSASATVAKMIDPSRKPIVVFESTVFPGVTEDICGPIIEEISGLVRSRDFFLGYSPERINPGDREHTIDRITKIIAGESPAITDKLRALYGAITTGGTFVAASIRVAETAKAIENAQRDINIAFINEVAQIVDRLGVSVWDVLEAAGTKWNFLPFRPGLVGGHCIGVDPFYLSHCAEMLGHTPAVILTGRATNDAMGEWVADRLCAGHEAGADVLILGATYKENVRDVRNSRVKDVLERVLELGHSVNLHDPRADRHAVAREYNIDLLHDLPSKTYDIVLLAVAHEEYTLLAPERLAALVKPGGVFGDLKNVIPESAAFAHARRWTL